MSEYSLSQRIRFPKIPELVRRLTKPIDSSESTFGAVVDGPVIFSEKIDGTPFDMDSEKCYIGSCANSTEKVILNGYYKSIKDRFEDDFQYFGVMVYQTRSLKYEDLPHYLLFHSIYDKNTGTFEPWESTRYHVEDRLGMNMVPKILELKYDDKLDIHGIASEILNSKSRFSKFNMSGVVIRRSLRFTGQASSLFMAQKEDITRDAFRDAHKGKICVNTVSLRNYHHIDNFVD